MTLGSWAKYVLNYLFCLSVVVRRKVNLYTRVCVCEVIFSVIPGLTNSKRDPGNNNVIFFLSVVLVFTDVCI